jgi:hypothetical protein
MLIHFGSGIILFVPTTCNPTAQGKIVSAYAIGLSGFQAAVAPWGLCRGVATIQEIITFSL